jgi:hypothetical protein
MAQGKRTDFKWLARLHWINKSLSFTSCPGDASQRHREGVLHYRGLAATGLVQSNVTYRLNLEEQIKIIVAVHIPSSIIFDFVKRYWRRRDQGNSRHALECWDSILLARAAVHSKTWVTGSSRCNGALSTHFWCVRRDRLASERTQVKILQSPLKSRDYFSRQCLTSPPKITLSHSRWSRAKRC